MNIETKNNQFQEILEKATSIEEYREKHIELLREAKSYNDLLWANKMEVSSAMFAEENIKQFYMTLQKLEDYLESLSKITGIKLEISARRKSLISLCRKIQLHLVLKNPLDEIFDELGIRIIVGDSEIDNKILLDLCDVVMNGVLNFLVKEGGVPKDLKQSYKKGFKPEDHPDVIVQEKSLIDSRYKNNIKNYNKNPKPNGYQGLHAVVQLRNGVLFEIQVRTKAMHLRAESGNARHDSYKDDRYKVIEEKGNEIFDLDLSKAHIKGVSIKDGEIIDEVGFVKPLCLKTNMQ